MDDYVEEISLRDEIVDLRDIVESCANNIFTLMNVNTELRKEVSELKEILLQHTGVLTSNVPAPACPPSLDWKIVEQKKKPLKKLIINPTSVQNVGETRKILNKIDPKDYNVKSVKPTQKGGVIIECESSAERQQLMTKSAAVFNSDYSVSIPIKKMPRVRIYGITVKYEESELVEILKRQNCEMFSDNCSVKVEYMSLVEKKMCIVQN